jgi:BlaI family transcriptional regulator, penicillinase repressor
MPRRVSDLPAESELEVLSILWREGPSTVRRVHEALQADGRETSMTTTLKTMQIMVEKGFLKCGDKRPAVYAPAVPAERTQAGLVKRLAKKAFEGSMGKLLMRAVQEGDLSAEELREIRRVIEGKKC